MNEYILMFGSIGLCIIIGLIDAFVISLNPLNYPFFWHMFGLHPYRWREEITTNKEYCVYCGKQFNGGTG